MEASSGKGKTVEVTRAPDEGGDPGLAYVALSAILVAFCVMYSFPGGERQRGLAAAACWAASAAVLAAKKLVLSPPATFALAAETVVLSTVALGSLIPSFAAFVATSTVTTGAQAFLSLPMKIKTSED